MAIPLLVQCPTGQGVFMSLNVAQTSNTASNRNGTKMVQGVGASLHYRLGFKARFSGVGDTAYARFKHLNGVKEGGVHAHDCVFFMQLTKECTELQAALILRNAYEPYKAHCDKAKLHNGYTESHYSAILGFISSHSSAAIQDAENNLEGIDIAQGGIYG